MLRFQIGLVEVSLKVIMPVLQKLVGNIPLYDATESESGGDKLALPAFHPLSDSFMVRLRVPFAGGGTLRRALCWCILDRLRACTYCQETRHPPPPRLGTDEEEETGDDIAARVSCVVALRMSC